MKKAISTFLIQGWRVLILTVFLISATTTSHAQCFLACNDLIQVSLDENCEAEIQPDDILEGNNCPNGNLHVQAKINGIWVPASGNFVATAANINQTIQVRVRDLNSGNLCGGLIHVEDKLPPQLTCTNITIN